MSTLNTVEELIEIGAGIGNITHICGALLEKEAGIELLYAPYVPNKAEYLILTNRRILSDQMEFLRQHVAAHSRLVLATA